MPILKSSSACPNTLILSVIVSIYVCISVDAKVRRALRFAEAADSCKLPFSNILYTASACNLISSEKSLILIFS